MYLNRKWKFRKILNILRIIKTNIIKHIKKYNVLFNNMVKNKKGGNKHKKMARKTYKVVMKK